MFVSSIAGSHRAVILRASAACESTSVAHQYLCAHIPQAQLPRHLRQDPLNLRIPGRQPRSWPLCESGWGGGRGAPASCWCSRCGSRCGSRGPARRCWCCRCSAAPPPQRATAAAADPAGTTASAATLRSASSSPVNLEADCMLLSRPRPSHIADLALGILSERV